MTETSLTTTEPTRQAVAVKGRSAPGKVTGKLKTAIDAMIWEGSRRDEAAQKAGLSDHGVRTALTKPHVKAYYLGQLEVLRTSERARNIHALTNVRDGTNAMARVNAVKALEQLGEDTPAGSRGSVSVPGLVVQIVMPSGGATIDHVPHEVTDKPLK